MYAFEIERPSTIAAAVAALADADADAQALGGGQTLIPALKQRLAAPSKLVSLLNISEMRGICISDANELCVGAATPHAVIRREAEGPFNGLALLAGQIGDPAVRNRGTAGGSLANNDPSACYPAAALATGATIKTDRREIAAAEFFQGLFTTALEDGEIIIEIRFPIPQASNYQKFAQPASRFALVGVFVAKYANGVRVAVTGASEDGVYRWTAAETALSAAFDAAALDGVTASADGMISDLHGTPEYRAHLIGVMTRRAVAAAQ